MERILLILWSAGLSHGYTSPFWLTYKQAADMGGQVKKGEHGTHCVFYKPWESEGTNKDTGETETTKGAVIKTFTAFNLDQIDGIQAPAKEERPVFTAIEAAESIMAASPAPIKIGGTQACYIPSRDEIHLPAREAFINPEAFYSTAMHEMTHSTGAKSRLDRDFSGRFGTEAYAFEELCAEIGSAFLNSDLGILGATLADHADYLTNWNRKWRARHFAINHQPFIMRRSNCDLPPPGHDRGSSPPHYFSPSVKVNRARRARWYRASIAVVCGFWMGIQAAQALFVWSPDWPAHNGWWCRD